MDSSNDLDVASRSQSTHVKKETMKELLDFSGKCIVVTGASSGIGRACAIAFAQNGAKVSAVARSKDRLKSVIDEMSRFGPGHVSIATDLAEEDSASTVVSQTVDGLGGIDVVVNCAASIHREQKDLDTTDKSTWDHLMRTNVRSYYLLSMKAFPHLALHSGNVVNISSIWAFRGAKKQVAYSVSKASILELTRSMALDFAESHVRVNCVCPATVNTPLLMKGRTEFDADAVAKLHPLGRIGEPVDIANSVLFLASPAASWITGVGLPVDGGYCAK